MDIVDPVWNTERDEVSTLWERALTKSCDLFLHLYVIIMGSHPVRWLIPPLVVCADGHSGWLLLSPKCGSASRSRSAVCLSSIPILCGWDCTSGSQTRGCLYRYWYIFRVILHLNAFTGNYAAQYRFRRHNLGEGFVLEPGCFLHCREDVFTNALCLCFVFEDLKKRSRVNLGKAGLKTTAKMYFLLDSFLLLPVGFVPPQSTSIHSLSLSQAYCSIHWPLMLPDCGACGADPQCIVQGSSPAGLIYWLDQGCAGYCMTQ